MRSMLWRPYTLIFWPGTVYRQLPRNMIDLCGHAALTLVKLIQLARLQTPALWY